MITSSAVELDGVEVDLSCLFTAAALWGCRARASAAARDPCDSPV